MLPRYSSASIVTSPDSAAEASRLAEASQLPQNNDVPQGSLDGAWGKAADAAAAAAAQGILKLIPKQTAQAATPSAN